MIGLPITGSDHKHDTHMVYPGCFTELQKYFNTIVHCALIVCRTMACIGMISIALTSVLSHSWHYFCGDPTVDTTFVEISQFTLLLLKPHSWHYFCCKTHSITVGHDIGKGSHYDIIMTNGTAIHVYIPWHHNAWHCTEPHFPILILLFPLKLTIYIKSIAQQHKYKFVWIVFSRDIWLFLLTCEISQH